MRIEIPDFCIVVLVGPSGSGKTWLARRLFADDEVLSSDHFRKLVCGAEGMVVKPLDFIARQGTRLLQPAIKCRGREYLRTIYGAEYTENLDSLKARNLASKRKRALAEFALGLEALERFVRGEPLNRVHECVFTILALESEPQDARL